MELTDLGRSGMRRLLSEPEPGAPVYQVKITLLGVAPVWRRVLVRAAIRLDRLHEVIQAVMGWQNVDWDHEILIEEAVVAESGARYPQCLAGQAACPPEDVGGWPGYARLVDILTDPGHEEHQDMLDWFGLDSRGQFDPERFDPAEAASDWPPSPPDTDP